MKFENMIRTGICSVIFAVSSICTVAVAQDRPESIGLGVFTFTSGPAAAYGIPGKNAAELMIDIINKDGGIGGVPLRATYVDEAQGAQGVITDYRRLTEAKSNQIMIAALSSGNCLALKPIAEQTRMPTVAWNCDTYQLFEDGVGDYYFRPNGNVTTEFAAFAAYVLATKPDVKTIGLINPDYAMGHDASEIFQRTLKALKPEIKVVADLFPKLGTSNFQSEISRFSTQKPDIIFSALWGADLENFARQADARGLLRSSNIVLALGETILQRVPLPDGVVVGVLGDGWWMSPDAQKNPLMNAFVDQYHERFGEYPVFPSMKMANTFVFVKNAMEHAIERKADGWPSRENIAEALAIEGESKTLTGKVIMRSDHDGVVDQIIGVTRKTEDHDFPIIVDMVRYDGAKLMPAIGQDPLEWASSLTPEHVSKLMAPGEYR